MPKQAFVFLFFLFPLLLRGQEEDMFRVKSTFSITNPQVGQYIRFYPIWSDDLVGMTFETMKTLDSLSYIISADRNLAREIGYHTDCRASEEYNKRLSTGYAKDIWSYLVSKGADSLRLTYHGYGEEQLLNNCSCEASGPGAPMEGPGMNCTEAEHAVNRRVEIKLIEIRLKKG
jgi:hypothetical protein